MCESVSFRTSYLVLILLASGSVSASGRDPSGRETPPGNATTADKPAQEPEQEPLTEAAEQARQALEQELAKDSEGRVMLDDIVRGSRLGPGDGWFRIAVSQTRYDWTTVAGLHDRNQDGKIARDEFPGSDADFNKLDRDDGGAINAADLDWSELSSSRSPGVQLFFAGDHDGNGKLTRDEFSRLFDRLDEGKHGFLALDEVRGLLTPPPDTGGNVDRPDRPTRSTLILGLMKQEIGSLQPGPNVGEMAPDFTLKSLQGDTVTLSKEVGKQPLVLIFGNFTCGPFRSQSGNIEKLYERYKDRAKFLLVYVREAHPSDGWWMTSNQRVGIELAQPTSHEQRIDIARRCQTHLDLQVPFLVDDVSDTVGAKYSGMPNRLYLIDRDGRIAFKSGRGPFGFKPGELEQSLIWLTSKLSGQ